MKKLVVGHEFNNSNIPGNCGIRHIYRLAGNYITEHESERNKLRGVSAIPEPKGRRAAISTMLSWLKHPTTQRHGLGYPLEWAFTDIIEGALGGRAYSLISMTDTKDGAGDGHNGLFATRNFAEWLINNNLCTGTMVEAERYKDTDDSRGVYAWYLHPDFLALEAQVKKVKAEIAEYIKQHNNDPNIKKAIDEKKAAEDLMKNTINNAFDVWQQQPAN